MKKIASILICAVLAMSVIGCTKNSDGGGEKPVLKVLQMYYKENLNETGIAKLLEERTGYKVEYETLPQDKPYEKLNILMSSSEAYDVVAIGNNKNVFAEYALAGALTELNGLIDTYGKNMRNAVSKENLEMIEVNNKIYGIPNMSGGFVADGILVRKDWLDKLGMKTPETLGEFTDMLRAFKEKDPGGNGDKNIPFVINGSGPFITNVVGAFGLASRWSEVNGTILPIIMRPEVKEYYEYARMLYRDNLIDSEFPVNKAVASREKFTSGRAGAMVLGWYDIPTVMSAIKQTVQGAEAIYLPVLKNSDGRAGLNLGSGIDKIIFIPKNAKNPVDAMKWMDAKLEAETFKEFSIGNEGVHYEVKDGKYYPIAPKFFDERDAATVYLTGVDERVYNEYWQARVRKDEALYNAWDFLNNHSPNKDYLQRDYANIAPCISDFNKNIERIDQMLTEFSLNVIVGKEQVSAVDSFIERWKAEGGQKAYDAINEWYKLEK